MLVAIIALSIFSLLGLFVSLNATTETRISDNHEAMWQADFAARAGIEHARELIMGLDHDDLLQGPDKSYSTSASYLSSAATYGFRNWISWQTARSLDITSPTSAVSGLPDDGMFNTGKYGTTNGTPLIPADGKPLPNLASLTARYFVKATDNQAEECAAGIDCNPFVDKDDIIIVRSMGVSRTIREAGGGVVRANSAVAYEARFRRGRTFDLTAPVVLQGNSIDPAAPNMFNGNAFSIQGGASQYGIGLIDTNTADGSPSAKVKSYLSSGQDKLITGYGGTPSVGDITSGLTADQVLLTDPAFLWKFSRTIIPAIADSAYYSNQSWSGGAAPDLGYYDRTKSVNDLVQRPRITYVQGDLSLSGKLSGAGILLVTGELSGTGSLDWNGIILAIGKGIVNFAGMNVGIYGGLYAVNLIPGDPPTFGNSQFTISGKSDIIADDVMINMTTRRLPQEQLSWRQVYPFMDPP